MTPRTPLVQKEDASLPAMFNPLHSSTNQQIGTMKITDDFCYEWKPSWPDHVPTTKSTLFVVSKGEWVTKEGTGKSMKNALHVQRYVKRHPLGWSNIEQ